jgi:hypothetical protein
LAKEEITHEQKPDYLQSDSGGVMPVPAHYLHSEGKRLHYIYEGEK